MERIKKLNDLTKDSYGVIYKITNTVNNKIYIGQTINFSERYRSHCEVPFRKSDRGYNHPIYRAIRKYGINNFTIEIIEYCSPIEELNDRETHYIKLYDCLVDSNKGYNLQEGGQNGKKSKQTRKKMSNSQKGTKNPSFGKKGSDSFRAVRCICLDTGIIYGSMIDCAMDIFQDPNAKKFISRVADPKSNRISYKNYHFAKFDENNNIIYKPKQIQLTVKPTEFNSKAIPCQNS